MANLTSTTITGTLNTTSTITGPGSGVSQVNASNVASGTLQSDRLPTVPTSKGGTGLTSIGSADQVLKVNAGGTALEFGAAGGGGNLITQVYTGSTTWTKPADLAAVKVTCVGGGGGAGAAAYDTNAGSGGAGGVSIETIPAASIPGPVSVTVGPAGTGGAVPGGGQSGNPGGTSSFGAFLSATGGQGGNRPTNNNTPGNPGAPGGGSGGQINQPGPNDYSQGGYTWGGFGAGGLFNNPSPKGGYPGTGYGGGGKGGQYNPPSSQGGAGGNGAPGLVIIDEIY